MLSLGLIGPSRGSELGTEPTANALEVLDGRFGQYDSPVRVIQRRHDGEAVTCECMTIGHEELPALADLGSEPD